MYRVLASILLVVAVLGGYFLANGSLGASNSAPDVVDSGSSAPAAAPAAAPAEDEFSKLKM